MDPERGGAGNDAITTYVQTQICPNNLVAKKLHIWNGRTDI
jgi:hypothetical protein